MKMAKVGADDAQKILEWLDQEIAVHEFLNQRRAAEAERSSLPIAEQLEGFLKGAQNKIRGYVAELGEWVPTDQTVMAVRRQMAPGDATNVDRAEELPDWLVSSVASAGDVQKVTFKNADPGKSAEEASFVAALDGKPIALNDEFSNDLYRIVSYRGAAPRAWALSYYGDNHYGLELFSEASQD